MSDVDVDKSSLTASANIQSRHSVHNVCPLMVTEMQGNSNGLHLSLI